MAYLIAAYLIALGLILGLVISIGYRRRKALQELAALDAADDADAVPVAAGQ